MLSGVMAGMIVCMYFIIMLAFALALRHVTAQRGMLGAGNAEVEPYSASTAVIVAAFAVTYA